MGNLCMKSTKLKAAALRGIPTASKAEMRGLFSPSRLAKSYEKQASPIVSNLTGGKTEMFYYRKRSGLTIRGSSFVRKVI